MKDKAISESRDLYEEVCAYLAMLVSRDRRDSGIFWSSYGESVKRNMLVLIECQ
jgi:hypothetical protein